MGLIGFALFFIISVIGVNVIWGRAVGKAREFTAGAADMCPSRATPPSKRKNDKDYMVDRIMAYVEAENWKVDPDTLPIVKTNPVLSSMLEDLDAIEPLEYVLPDHGIRVHHVDNNERVLVDAGFDRKVSFDGVEVGYKRKRK